MFGGVEHYLPCLFSGPAIRAGEECLMHYGEEYPRIGYEVGDVPDRATALDENGKGAACATFIANQKLALNDVLRAYSVPMVKEYGGGGATRWKKRMRQWNLTARRRENSTTTSSGQAKVVLTRLYPNLPHSPLSLLEQTTPLRLSEVEKRSGPKRRL